MTRGRRLVPHRLSQSLCSSTLCAQPQRTHRPRRHIPGGTHSNAVATTAAALLAFPVSALPAAWALQRDRRHSGLRVGRPASPMGADRCTRLVSFCITTSVEVHRDSVLIPGGTERTPRHPAFRAAWASFALSSASSGPCRPRLSARRAASSSKNGWGACWAYRRAM